MTPARIRTVTVVFFSFREKAGTVVQTCFEWEGSQGLADQLSETLSWTYGPQLAHLEFKFRRRRNHSICRSTNWDSPGLRGPDPLAKTGTVPETAPPTMLWSDNHSQAFLVFILCKHVSPVHVSFIGIIHPVRICAYNYLCWTSAKCFRGRTSYKCPLNRHSRVWVSSFSLATFIATVLRIASRPRLNPCLLFMGSFVEWCGWDEKWVQSILCLPATNNLFVSPGSSPTKRSWLGSQRQCLWVVRCRFLQRCCSESHVCPVHWDGVKLGKQCWAQGASHLLSCSYCLSLRACLVLLIVLGWTTSFWGVLLP